MKSALRRATSRVCSALYRRGHERYSLATFHASKGDGCSQKRLQRAPISMHRVSSYKPSCVWHAHMLRKLPKTESSDAVIPSVRSMLAPEMPLVQHKLAAARSAAAALRALKQEFARELTQSLPCHAERLGLPAERLQAWIEGELARFIPASSLRILVHPSDAARIETSGLAARVAFTGVLEFVNDADLTPGGCLIESERGTLDARVETKLSSLIAVICGLETP